MNKRKLNVLNLQTELNIACGISKTIFNLIEGSIDRNNYFILSFGGDGIERFRSIGIDPIILGYNKNNIFFFPIIILKVYKICKKNHIDIIHTHHRYFDVIAFFVSRYIKIKTITSVQSIVKKRILISYMSHEFIACSNTVKNHLIEYFKIDRNKINVINNFINLLEKKITTEKTELIKKMGIADNQFIIGYFGRFDISEKGIDILINGVENIRGINPNIFLLLIGRGKDEIIIRNLLEKSKINWKILEPQLPIYDYYNLIDIFVLPSKVDPFPLVMLEAGLMKKPFIGSKVDGISEYIQDGINGLLFEPGNANELSDLILSLIDDKEKADHLGENLYHKVIENNTSDKALKLYQEVYERMIYDGE